MFRSSFARSATLATIATSGCLHAEEKRVECKGAAKVLLIPMPVKITKQQDLEFGEVLITKQGGRVTLEPGGSVEPSEKIVLGNGIRRGPGIFHVELVDAKNFSINLQDKVELVHQEGGGDDKSQFLQLQLHALDVNNTKSEIRGTTTSTFKEGEGVLPDARIQIVKVGGILTIPANARPGNYSASFKFDLVYPE